MKQELFQVTRAGGIQTRLPPQPNNAAEAVNLFRGSLKPDAELVDEEVKEVAEVTGINHPATLPGLLGLGENLFYF